MGVILENRRAPCCCYDDRELNVRRRDKLQVPDTRTMFHEKSSLSSEDIRGRQKHARTRTRTHTYLIVP